MSIIKINCLLLPQIKQGVSLSFRLGGRKLPFNTVYNRYFASSGSKDSAQEEGNKKNNESLDSKKRPRQSVADFLLEVIALAKKDDLEEELRRKKAYDPRFIRRILYALNRFIQKKDIIDDFFTPVCRNFLPTGRKIGSKGIVVPTDKEKLDTAVCYQENFLLDMEAKLEKLYAQKDDVLDSCFPVAQEKLMIDRLNLKKLVIRARCNTRRFRLPILLKTQKYGVVESVDEKHISLLLCLIELVVKVLLSHKDCALSRRDALSDLELLLHYSEKGWYYEWCEFYVIECLANYVEKMAQVSKKRLPVISKLSLHRRRCFKFVVSVLVELVPSSYYTSECLLEIDVKEIGQAIFYVVPLVVNKLRERRYMEKEEKNM